MLALEPASSLLPVQKTGNLVFRDVKEKEFRFRRDRRIPIFQGCAKKTGVKLALEIGVGSEVS